MKISKNSWHYKLLREELSVDIGLTNSRPTSLCKYFWMVVLGCIYYVLFITPGKLLMKLNERVRPDIWYWSCFFIIVLSTSLGLGYLAYLFSQNNLMDFLIVTGTVFSVVGIILGFMLIVIYKENYGFTFHKKWRMFQFLRKGYENEEGVEEIKERKPKEPNLLIEFLKASKNKTCPIIEFTETEVEIDNEKENKKLK